MPADPPKTPADLTRAAKPRAQAGKLLEFGRRPAPASSERPPEVRVFAANDQADPSPADPRDLSGFRAEVAPLLAVLGYHLADPAVMAPAAPAFVERRRTPSTLDRLAELEAQIARDGDPSGLRHRLRRLLLSELELLGVVGRRREDRPLAEAAARALRG